MTRILSSLLIAAFLVLAGCGGGSSSSDGGGSTSSAAGSTSDTAAPSGSESGPSSSGEENSVAGTYVGTGTATLSIGEFTQTQSIPVQIVISPDNTVAFGKPGEPPLRTAALNANGDGFSLSVPASLFNKPGLNCAGELNVTGSINGNSMTGDVSDSEGACNGVPVDVVGSFNLDKTG